MNRQAILDQQGDEVTEEVRYYILGEYLDGKQFAQAVRQYWSVENDCHWQLDVLFRENDSRVRERTLANKLSWLRRVAITLLKHQSFHRQRQRKATTSRMERTVPRASTAFLLTKLRNSSAFSPVG